MELITIDSLDVGRKVDSGTADYAVVKLCECGTKYYERVEHTDKSIMVCDFWYNHRKVCCKRRTKHRDYSVKDESQYV